MTADIVAFREWLESDTGAPAMASAPFPISTPSLHGSTSCATSAVRCGCWIATTSRDQATGGMGGAPPCQRRMIRCRPHGRPTMPRGAAPAPTPPRVPHAARAGPHLRGEGVACRPGSPRPKDGCRIEGQMGRWMGRHRATMETCCGRGHLFQMRQAPRRPQAWPALSACRARVLRVSPGHEMGL